MSSSPIYTVREAAAILGVSTTRVYQLIKLGDLKTQIVDVGKGRWQDQMFVSGYSIEAHRREARQALGAKRREAAKAQSRAETRAAAAAQLERRAAQHEAWAAEQTRLRLEREASG